MSIKSLVVLMKGRCPVSASHLQSVATGEDERAYDRSEIEGLLRCGDDGNPNDWVPPKNIVEEKASMPLAEFLARAIKKN